MSQGYGIRQRAAARNALLARTRMLTGGALALSAVLSGIFAGIAGASAPGHKLLPHGSARGAKAPTGRQIGAPSGSSTAIPPLPAAPGPGNLSASPPPAPTPAPAPSSTSSPPAVVSGGS